jgi:hypothetical protein
MKFMSKLTKLQIETETAAVIAEAYQSAVSAANGALLKVAACGLLLWEKQRVSAHGEFLPWLAEHCPEIPQRTAYRWIDTAKNLCRVLDVGAGAKHAGLPLHQVLQLPADQLAGRAAKMRSRVEGCLDGKTADQLTLRAETEGKPAGKAGAPRSKAAAKRQAAEQAGVAFVSRMQELRQQKLVEIMPAAAKAQVFEEWGEFARYMKGAKAKGRK